MKLIASRNFANVPAFNLKPDSAEPEKLQITRGNTFIIGDGDDLAALDSDSQRKISFLLHMNCAICDTPANKARIETLRKEIASQKAADAKANAPTPGLDLLAKQVSILLAASAKGADKALAA